MAVPHATSKGFGAPAKQERGKGVPKKKDHGRIDGTSSKVADVKNHSILSSSQDRHPQMQH